MEKESKNRPKFSVIIGLYNQLDNLPKLIESLSNQSFKDFEVHFCDDKSTDGTKEFFRAGPEFKFKHYHHRPFFKKHLAGNLNQGIKKANGEYCVFIMGDSFPELNYLEVLNDHINEDTIVCGLRVQVDGKRAVDVDWRIVKGKIPQHEALIINTPYEVLTGNGLAIPTEAMRKYGMWDTKMKDYGGEDTLILAKLYYKGYLCKSVPSLVLYHNWHKGNDSSERNKNYTSKQVLNYYYAK